MGETLGLPSLPQLVHEAAGARGSISRRDRMRGANAHSMPWLVRVGRAARVAVAGGQVVRWCRARDVAAVIATMGGGATVTRRAAPWRP